MGSKGSKSGSGRQGSSTDKWVEKQKEGKLPPDVTLLLRENQSLKDKLLKGKGTEAAIVAAVKEVFERPAEIVLPRPPKAMGKGPEETAFLHISDLQMGKRTNTYDHVVAAKRIQLLAQKTVEITQMRRSAATIKELVLVLGGDINEGENLFGSQPHHISICLIDQATKQSPECLLSAVLYLLGYFQKIKIFCVPGNHGRNGRIGEPGMNEKTNWDRVTYRVLETMLLGSDENPHSDIRKRIDMHVSDTFWNVARIYDWGVLNVHGNQVQGGFAGFPWYGAAKKVWGWIDSIPEAFDYITIGHFHTFAKVVLNHRILLANGTVESDNEYAQEQLAACGHPCQRLAFFNAKHGLIADHQVFLADREPQRKRVKKW